MFIHRLGLAAFLEECAIALKERPTGFSLALIATAMLGVFAIRMYLGISSLPLRLGGSRSPEDESAERWGNTQMLIFVLVCPLFLLDRFSGVLFSIPNWWLSTWGFSLYIIVVDVVTASLLVLVAILILGESGRRSARSSLRLPEPRFAFFGLLLPVFISLTISSIQYGYDRAQWAAHEFGRASPPEFMNYFSLGAAWRWAPVLTVFGVFAEEIVFRGMLLGPLLRRYGLHRGMFFTGLTWAALHFHGDMHLRYSMAQVLLQLASRVAICLAMNHVLSWMTLRWNSIIPAAIAHTISNVLVVSGTNGGVPFAHEMRIALWALLAYVLFRYWPVQMEDDLEAAPSVANPEPAT